MYPFADITLARRLEAAEAASSARFVEARARLTPGSGAGWIQVAGAHAIYDGPESPLTQTFGLGLFEPPTNADLNVIEQFFTDRGAPVLHEVSPLADPALLPLLTERGYQPFEFTSVLYQPIEAMPVVEQTLADGQVRLIEPSEAGLWAETAAAGWGDYEGVGEWIREIGRVSAEAGSHLFLVERHGQAIATGALTINAGVAHLAGASTIPEGRQRGAQLALLEHRLRYAAAAGCDLAAMGALPGSGSQRNAERHGFRVAYTRIKWRQPVRS